MAQGSDFDLLCEVIFPVFFYFLASKLFNHEHPLLSALFFPQHQDDRRVPTSPECSSSSSSSSSSPETEHMQTEEPSHVMCEICVETKRITQMIKNQTCDHSYCSDCMAKHVAVKIQDSITTVPCPGLGCESVFELATCQSWLPKDVLEKWDKALCEALFLQVPKFYCPYKDCSAMMLVEDEEDEEEAETECPVCHRFMDCSAMMLVEDEEDEEEAETECPVCHRLFCVSCNVPWHIGVNCKEYQKLDENERQMEDLLVRKLAKEKQWKRCPRCKFYVEKVDGCLHITCRCTFQFCYECGRGWSDDLHDRCLRRN